MKRLLLYGLILASISGCSSVAIDKPLDAKQVFPVPVAYCIKSSAKPNQIKKLTSEDEAKFKQQTDTALDDIHTAFTKKISASHTIALSEYTTCVDENKKTAVTSSTDTENFELIIDLSSYDSIKAKWKYYLIGSGIGEGIVQGVVVAGATHNTLLGIGVALEEFASEYLTWNGVDWILGETYAPVTLEAKLIRTSDEKIVWSDTEFVTENDDETKNLPEKEQKNKEKQLLASLHKAEQDLFSSLNDYLTTKFVAQN